MTDTRPVTSLLMIKPHAVERDLEPVITEIINDPGLAWGLDSFDPLREVLPQLAISDRIAIDLKSDSCGPALLDLFYQDKANRRYFPLIKEQYLGRVILLPLSISADAVDLQTACDAIKGTTETFDDKGNQVTTAAGLRGYLGTPYQHYSNEDAALFDDVTYRKAFLPVVNNFVHVCDKPGEAKHALEIVTRKQL